MESKRRGKRKSPSQDIIFEVSDGDISPDPSDEGCSEPDAKIMKTDGNFLLTSTHDSNLESEKQNLSPKISPHEEEQNGSVVIVDCNSLSNNNSIEISSGNDIIDITLDDISTPIDNEEACSKPNEDSINIDIVDITEENDIPLTEDARSPLKEDDFNLEEGELEDIPIEVHHIDAGKSKPCICITFRDENITEIYKSKFLKFIQSFVELEVENFEGLTINVRRDPALSPSEWVVLDETLCLSDIVKEKDVICPVPSLEEISPPKKKKKKKHKKDKQSFILDTNPSENANNGLCTIYSTKFQIDINEKATPDEKAEIKISAQICFNCGGSHAMKDCPKPKDFARINVARQKFKAQKQTARYHMEEDQKYGHLAPGKISNKLRDALGLRRNQLPPYIYQMRLLGYPPGWLEEAKFVHSNLEMFDTEGNNVREGTTKKKQGLDPEKIVNYPGFNVPLPQDVRDEYRQYGVPPFSQNFSKKAMIDFFEKQFAKQQDDFETCSMELDTTLEEESKEVVRKEVNVGRIIINPQIIELKEIDSNMPSPSLVDLEKQKETLLAALEDNSSSNPKSVETCGELEKSDVEISSDVEKSKACENAAEKVPVHKNLEIDIEKAQDSSTSFSSPPISSGVNTVKNSTFGTPILKSSSPYLQLPNPDNFMKDVSPVINFENLPNSTGKYEQMTEVLQKVRNTLKKKLQNCKL